MASPVVRGVAKPGGILVRSLRPSATTCPKCGVGLCFRRYFPVLTALTRDHERLNADDRARLACVAVWLCQEPNCDYCRIATSSEIEQAPDQQRRA
jgi:hypothetical protein